jgi:hypothetical protein
LLADTSAETLSDRTFLVGGDGEAWDLLRTRLRSMPKPPFPLEGRDLVSLGMPPGPRIGALLRTVRSWWLAGGCVADSDACRAEARRLIEG